MSAELPAIELEAFAARLNKSAPRPLSQLAARLCFAHYGELRRWNRRLSLIGVGTAESVIERHYGESLSALDELRPSDRTLVDIGSGAGFPGFVIAAARPDLDVFLVESRNRKWSFLQTVSRRARDLCETAAGEEARPWSCTCLAARIGSRLPAGLPTTIDVVTSRAVNLRDGEILQPIADHSPAVRFLLWQGANAPRFERFDSVAERALPGSTHRRIITLLPQTPPENGSIES